MAGLVLIFLPLILLAAVAALFVIAVVASIHLAITWWCFDRWPFGTVFVTLLWLALCYQTGEPFFYAQVARFVQPANAWDGPHEEWFPNLDWMVLPPGRKVKTSVPVDSDGKEDWTHRLKAYDDCDTLWMTRIWYRSRWFGSWGDTRERKQHTSLQAALQHVRQRSGPGVDCDVFAIKY